MKSTKEEKSWILYDVANSAFTLIITTTLVPIFYKEFVAAGSGAQSTADWGFTVSAASLILAILAPMLGTLADYRGYKKRFFATALTIGLLFTLALPIVQQGQMLLCLVIYVIAKVGYSAANIFYNSFLTDVTTNDRMDNVSSYGFGYGYIGSVFPFIASLAVILGIQAASGTTAVPPLGMKIAFLITAVWWLIFSLPMLRNVHQHYGIDPEPGQIKESFLRLARTFQDIRQYKQTFLFLLAYFLYIDGIYTIISMSAAYGMDLGFGTTTLLGVILFIQVVAWPFALIYGRLASRFNTKPLLFTGIGIYAAATFLGFMLPAFSNPTVKVLCFWGMAFLVATSQGGVQALSRSFFGKTIPKNKSAEFFGFYNIFGKFAAIMGPFLMALFTRITGESRFGVLSILILFVLGALLLLFVQEPKNTESSEPSGAL